MRWLLILALILATTIAGAVDINLGNLAEPSFTFQKGQQIDIKIPCENDGNACSNGSICNITVSYPNTSVLVNKGLMTNNLIYHNYTIPAQTILGEYQCAVYCIDNSSTGVTAFSFEITNNGSAGTDLTFVIALIFLTAMMFVIGLVLEKTEHKILQALCLIFGALFLFMIPTYFIIADLKSILYKITLGLVSLIALYVIGYMVYMLGIKLGLIVPKEGANRD